MRLLDVTTASYSRCLSPSGERDDEHSTDLLVETINIVDGKSICQYVEDRGHANCTILLISRLSHKRMVFVVEASSYILIGLLRQSYTTMDMYTTTGKWEIKSPKIPVSIGMTDQITIDASLTGLLFHLGHSVLSFRMFLVASTQLYKRVCPLVGLSVTLSLGGQRLVCKHFVYTNLFNAKLHFNLVFLWSSLFPLFFCPRHGCNV